MNRDFGIEQILKRGLFVGPSPKGEEFTIISTEPNGTVTITGVIADNGVIYITDQKWKPAKKYGKSVYEVAHSLLERIKLNEKETKE